MASNEDHIVLDYGRPPRRRSPFESFWRFVTGVVMVPFTAVWVGLFGYYGVTAALAGEVAAVVAMLVAGTWFGFMSWAALTYAFTGDYPRSFARLYNATWGRIAKPLPVRPSRP